MDDHSDYEILCTASGYILRAFLAPAPAARPNDDMPPIYYLSIGAFYMALCDGSQVFMTAFIDSSVRLYRKVGRRFYAIDRSAIDKKLTLNDMYITYDQCTTVMLHFFVQVAYIMNPTINVEEMMQQKHNDACVMETIQWIENLEVAIKTTTSKLSARNDVSEDDRLRHVFAKGYAVASLPYVCMLSTTKSLHSTIRRSKHTLGRRRLLPMIAIVIEGYLVYNSTQTESYKDCRSMIAQNEILLRLNLTLAQQAEANAAQLLSEEVQAEKQAKRKAEKKRIKRLRKKHRKEAVAAAIESSCSTTDDGTESDLDSVEILMDEFPGFSIMRRQLKAQAIGLSPDADPFVPH